MQTDFMDRVQTWEWGVAILGGLVASGKAVIEMQRANVQRREDLRWKRAEMAKKCVDELFANTMASAALKMLDWDGLCYEYPDGTPTGAITFAVRRLALRTTGTFFTGKGDERFVRDAYDALFDGFATLERLIEIKLIVFEDVKDALSYYVKKMGRAEEKEPIQKFLIAYEFAMAQRFLSRFQE